MIDSYPSPQFKTATYINQVNREHGQMLVEKVDLALIDTLGDGLADLVRAATVDHVQTRPAVLRLASRRGSHKERVSELALEVVLFDMVRQKRGHFPVKPVVLA
jgi:hypothetical protein